MKLIFAGTPAFAATALEAILAAGHAVPLVLTQPDRPAGRGLTVFQPARLRDPATHEPLRRAVVESAAELMVVAAYGLILPQAVLDIPPCGCINIHASLLPRWRGAAPIQRAIAAGDAETGITLMRMDAGLDTGAMLTRAALPIAPTDSAATLHDKLADLGASLIVEALARLPDLVATPQPEQGATYAAKIDKAEATLDWRRPAAELERAIRAFDPFPGAVASLDGVSLKLWKATPASGGGAPGTVLESGPAGIVVAAGSGAVRLLELQKPGGKRLTAAELLRGFPLKPGDRFALPGD